MAFQAIVSCLSLSRAKSAEAERYTHSSMGLHPWFSAVADKIMDSQYWGALLFMQTFLPDASSSEELATVVQAITGHDKDLLKIVTKVMAALILADKSDVHRDRVRKKRRQEIEWDIHDRVNYSVVNNEFLVEPERLEVVLKLQVDTDIIDPIEYFQIFTKRMSFCLEAAKYLGSKFVLIVNNFKLS